ncbi:hypothetical protein GpartN1_g2192.t1 [Galdieria partita]|uniref:Uncharacterized protein n=1 Tax=Galdieria partita TaxID=83374 RepID=A0A9C7PTV3_9RHOD|nr:hypothetical protein GpartN1_g2192.t1 [Galdieria partita]
MSTKQILKTLGKILISEHSINALRASLAAIGINVVIFFAILRRYIECFVGMFAFAIPVIVAQHTYIGAMIEACIIYSWGGLLSVVLAMTALAIADGNAIGLYFATLVEAFVVCILRTEPQYLGYGIVLSFLFGAILVYDVKVPPSDAWDKTFPLVVATVAASGACLISSLIIFPKSARRQLRFRLSKMLRDIGGNLDSLSEELVYNMNENEQDGDVITDKLKNDSDIQINVSESSFPSKSSLEISEFGVNRTNSAKIGTDIIQSCIQMRSSFGELKAMVHYIPFEPNLFPPWSAEPEDAWSSLIENFESLLLRVEALAGVLRRDHCFSPKVLGSSAKDPLEKLKELLKISKDYSLQLCTCLENINNKSTPDVVFAGDKLGNALNEDILNAKREHWRTEEFYTERENTVALAYASFIFVVFNVRDIFTNLEKLGDSILHIHRRRQELRFAPAKNLLFWVPTLIVPFKGWFLCYTYIGKPENIRYIVKYMICVAIILFPTMFVAQLSTSDFHFTQTYNAISAYIIVTILFWRSVELTRFRVVLYLSITLGGSALAYAATVFAPNMPWVLEIWLWFWTYFALLTAYHYPGYVIGTFPLVIAQFFIISCQYGHGFTFLYAASRTVSVAIGCLVVSAVSYFIWPYKGSIRIRQLLCGIIKTFEAIYCSLLDAFVNMNKNPYEIEGETSTTKLKEITGMLAKADGMMIGCRMMLIFELSPNYLHSSIPVILNNCSAIFRRLAILHFTCEASPKICGFYTDNIYWQFLEPLEDDISYLTQSVKSVLSAVCERVGKPREERVGPKRLEEALSQLVHAKKCLAKHYDQLRNAMFNRWKAIFLNSSSSEVVDSNNIQSLGDEPTEMQTDDAVRFLAWFYCLVITVESFERLANEGLTLKYEKRDDLKTILKRNAKPNL